MTGRHHWRPAGDGIRHAFRGWRWNGRTEDVSICGVRTTLAEELSETDWVRAPSCADCNRALRPENPGTTA